MISCKWGIPLFNGIFRSTTTDTHRCVKTGNPNEMYENKDKMPFWAIRFQMCQRILFKGIVVGLKSTEIQTLMNVV